MKITALIWSFIITLAVIHAGPVKRPDPQAQCSKKRSKLLKRESLHSVELTALEQQASGSGLYYIEYYGRMTVGTPAQTFNVIFQTGPSAAPWVIDSACRSPAFLDAWKFNSSKSTTYKAHPGTPWVVPYGGSGTAKVVEGVYGTDPLLVGNIALKDTGIGFAQKVYDRFAHHRVCGVLSLGPKMEASNSTSTFMKAVIDQNVISDPVFSVYLPSSRHGRYASGEIVFGGIDSRRFNGDLTWTPVIEGLDPSTWAIQIDGISFNDERLRTRKLAALNIAYPSIDVSKEAAEVFHKNIPGARPNDGRWEVPCDLRNSATGSISFTISGRASVFL
ncbi:Vacuolar protease A [Mortierella alpina]|nr:Vacuolar protease A [Mortierella alpina]